MTKIYLTWSSPPQVSFSASSAVCRINRAKEPALKMNKGDSFFLAARHFDDGFCHLQNVASVWFEEREGGGGKEIWHDSNFFSYPFCSSWLVVLVDVVTLVGVVDHPGVAVPVVVFFVSSSRPRKRGRTLWKWRGILFYLSKVSPRKIRILC